MLFSRRLVASSFHFVLSCTFAIVVAILVFCFWYPYPYREISGGRELFFIVIIVDVVLGPLVTLVVYDIKKNRTELRRDVICVVIIQALALIYGLWTVAVARPVHLVFEIDRFRVVHAVDVPVDLVSNAPTNVVVLPLTGPTLLGLRNFKNSQEEIQATLIALQGVALSFRPDLWQHYDVSRSEVLRVAKPINELKIRIPGKSFLIDSFLVEKKYAKSRISYLPLVGRSSFWTVLIDNENADVLGFLPLDPF